MKLYLVPFKQEAKLLTAILPNCHQVKNGNWGGEWSFNNGYIICWNQAGGVGVYDIVNRISDFSQYSEVIMFGSAGSLAHDLSMGQIFCCTTVKNTNGGHWQIAALPGFPECGILSTEALVFDNGKRDELWQKYQCELVDMETAAFAELAASGVFGSARVGAIRFVSDTYDILPEIDPLTNNFTGKFPPEVRIGITKYRKCLI